MNNGDSIETILGVFNETAISNLKALGSTEIAGACASGREWAQIINYLKISDNLKKLVLTETMTNENGTPLALCFTDGSTNTQDAIVAFKGTTGGDEWRDNVEGANRRDTDDQIKALAFIESLTNIIATGHSKGSNKAMYCTILSDKITRCVGYDGQGFSSIFLEEYRNQILARAHLIKNYSLSTDFVHILLYQIPGSSQITCKGYGVDNVKQNHSPNSFFVSFFEVLMLDENNLPMFVEEEEVEDVTVLHNYIDYLLEVGSTEDIDNMVVYISELFPLLFAGGNTDDILEHILSDEDNVLVILGSLLSYVEENDLDSDYVNSLLDTLGMTKLGWFVSKLIDLGLGQLTDEEEDPFLMWIVWQFGKKYIKDYLTKSEFYDLWKSIEDKYIEFSEKDHTPFDFYSNLTSEVIEKIKSGEYNIIIGTNGDNFIQSPESSNLILGLSGDDTILGSNGEDVVIGGKGDDLIYGAEGADLLYGGLGNDELHGGLGDDELFGDAGDDVLYGDSGNDKLFGDDGNDELHGGADNDELFGREGNDTLYGDGGDDYLEGGNGNNTMYGGEGNDTFVGGEDTNYMYGENGNDTFYGGNGPNYMYGGKGDDNFTGGEGYDYIEGGTGSDTMNGGNGFNEMFGQEGDDYIYGGNDKDYIDGGIGDDQLYGGNGNNTIYGQEGDDIIYDGDDGSHIYGGTGNDTIRAGGGNDVIDAGEGDDYIQDDHGDDTIIFKAGYGTDTISDAAGNNTIELSGLSVEDAVMSRINGSDLNISFGTDNIIIKQYFDGAGFQNFNINGTMINDLITTLHGSDADDWLSAWSDNGVTMNGEGGNDTLNGGNGDDVLEGGTGNDSLNGNSGNDTYIFSKNSGNDTIEDWNGSSLVKLTDINIDEISISKMNDSTLVLTIDSTGETLTVNGYKWNQGGYTFEFADGTTDSINKDTWKWESGFGSTAGEDTPPEQNIMNGTSGNDNLYGTDNNDIFDGAAGNDTLCGENGEDTYFFEKGYEADTINEWGSDHSVIQLTDINSDEVTITDQWGSNLILTVNGTNDTLTISNFKWGQSSYTFEFADGAVATVNKDTWELEFSQLPTAAQSEEEVIQSNADLLSDIYADDSISSDLLTEADTTVISEVSDSASVSDENEEIADQTDLQVMILTENMSAFSNENNISDSMNITDLTQDTTVMNQLLVNIQRD